MIPSPVFRPLDEFSVAAPFELGDWQVEPAVNRLRQGDRTIRLEPRVMALLVCLARREGKPISRQELLETVWSDTVVSDEAVTMAVSKLRRALGDSSKSPRWIETIAKKGYRLLVPVRWLSDEPKPALELVPAASFPAASPPRGPRRWPRRWLGVAALAAAALASVLVSGRWRTGEGEGAPAAALDPWRDVRLTSEAGSETQAEVSPDGARAVYVRQDSYYGSDVAPGVYVLSLADGVSRRLTDDPSATSPVWSPEGGRVAFPSCQAAGCRLRVVSTDDGRELRSFPTDACPLVGIDWSADGRWLATSLPVRGGSSCALFRIDVDSGAREQLTQPADELFDSRPTYSPDGSRIAFSRGPSNIRHDLFTMPAEGGEPRQVTHDGQRIWGFDWAPSGEELVLAANRRGPFQLWRVPVTGGEPRWIPLRAGQVRFPAVTGSHLIFEQYEVISDIWRWRPGSEPERPAHLLSDHRDSSPRYSADGRHIAFVSNRSGSPELWRTVDNGRLRRLTELGPSFMLRPEWSPDGRRLAVTAVIGERKDIYVVDALGGGATRLELGPESSSEPTWSADGRWLYFARRDQAGGWGLWKTPWTSGEPVKVVQGARYGLESADGRHLYFVGFGESAIWRRPAAGGAAVRVIDDLPRGQVLDWRLIGESILHLRPTESGLELVTTDLATRETRLLQVLPRGHMRAGISVSPADGSVLFSRYRSVESDLHWIAEFR